jgi:cbb3-type cytochrome oxidase maturation protein
MEAGVVLLIVGLGLLSGSALLAFAWAARDGQLEDLESGARVIFEEEGLTMKDMEDGEGDAGSHGGHQGHGENSDGEGVVLKPLCDLCELGVKPSVARPEDRG